MLVLLVFHMNTASFTELDVDRGVVSCTFVLIHVYVNCSYEVHKYQSKTISKYKNVSYEGQLCPLILKSQRVPNAPATQQIVSKHCEELKSSCPDSETLKNPF